MTLFPAPQYTQATVRVADIEPPPDALPGVAGQSIHQLGFFDPLTLKQTPSGSGVVRNKYEIVDGGGRYLEAVAQGLSEVIAVIVPQESDALQLAAIRLTSNVGRRSNLMQEAEAISHIIEALRRDAPAKVSDQELQRKLARDLGISPNVVRQRLSLLRLSPEMRQALREGRLGKTLARKVANVSEAQRGQLGAIFAQKGKLTEADFAQVRQAHLRAEQAGKGPAIFDTQPPPEIVEKSPKEQALELLSELVEKGLTMRDVVGLSNTVRAKAKKRWGE